MKKKLLTIGLTSVLFIALLAIGWHSTTPIQAEPVDFSDVIEAKLTALDAAAFDQFGDSVAIDGDTAVAGAHGDSDAGTDAGSAYVFTRSGGIWTQQAKLTALDGSAEDYFGDSVAISGDTAVVGAYGDDDAGSYSGSAYVFTRSGGIWTQQAKLTALDAVAFDQFGDSVAISGDTVVVGAWKNDDAGSSSGSAYVFIRSGGIWTQQAKLNALDGSSYNYFGYSVAICGDTAILGARGDSDADNDSGSAYVFIRSGGIWTQQAKLTALDAATDDRFGDSVAISGDTVVVGAYGDDDAGSYSGSAYVFTRSGGIWTQQAKLTALDAVAFDQFGDSVAISEDTAVVGAWQDDDAGTNSGSAYVFTRSGGIWTLQAKLTAGDAAVDDYFGISVAIDGDTAVVGAYGNNDAGSSSGSAYVYQQKPPEEFELLQDIIDKLETDLDTTVSSRASQDSVDDLSDRVDEIALLVNKIDIQFVSQLYDKNCTTLDFGTSIGGLPVEVAQVEFAQGIRSAEGLGLLHEEIDTSYIYLVTGPGHMQIEVDLPDDWLEVEYGNPVAENDYLMYLFHVSVDGYNGTIVVLNEFCKEK